MADRLLEGSIGILRDSLTGLSMRQRLIANNLANVDTPGYRAYDVSFERTLERQMRPEPGIAMLVTSERHMAGAEISLREALSLERQPVFHGDGNGVDVDSQMAKLSETTIEYNVVTQLLSARIAMLRSAVTEGRR